MHPQPPRRTTHVCGGPDNLLVYDRWGTHGRPVVLLHGLLFDRTMWWPAAAELASSCLVVAPDLPGHGQTPPRADHRVDDIAEDLAELVQRLHLRQAPIVVGHATSARLALGFADAYAVHCVLTFGEPPDDVTGVDGLIAAARLDEVPEQYRPYARPHRDPALLQAYDSWLVEPTIRRTEPPVAVAATAFPHLRDPAGFAAGVRSLL